MAERRTRRPFLADAHAGSTLKRRTSSSTLSVASSMTRSEERRPSLVEVLFASEADEDYPVRSTSCTNPFRPRTATSTTVLSSGSRKTASSSTWSWSSSRSSLHSCCSSVTCCSEPLSASIYAECSAASSSKTPASTSSFPAAKDQLITHSDITSTEASQASPGLQSRHFSHQSSTRELEKVLEDIVASSKNSKRHHSLPTVATTQAIASASASTSPSSSSPSALTTAYTTFASLRSSTAVTASSATARMTTSQAGSPAPHSEAVISDLKTGFGSACHFMDQFEDQSQNSLRPSSNQQHEFSPDRDAKYVAKERGHGLRLRKDVLTPASESSRYILAGNTEQVQMAWSQGPELPSQKKKEVTASNTEAWCQEKEVCARDLRDARDQAEVTTAAAPGLVVKDHGHSQSVGASKDHQHVGKTARACGGEGGGGGEDLLSSGPARTGGSGEGEGNRSAECVPETEAETAEEDRSEDDEAADSSSAYLSAASMSGGEESISGATAEVLSPLAARYHAVQGDDLSLHISIAQGGLQRIRRDAQSARVSLQDIVDIFGLSITNMARISDREILRFGHRCADPVTIFDGTSVPAVPLQSYMWRIVRALNAHADPAHFAVDGSDLSELSRLPGSGVGSGGTSGAAAASAASAATTFRSTSTNVQSGRGPPARRRPHREASTESLDVHSEPGLIGENSAMGRGLRCLLLAFVYIDRACTHHPDAFRIRSVSMHRIVLTAIYLALKFSDDTLPNAHGAFAKLGGISATELTNLEYRFCKLVDYRLYVTEAEFQALCMEQLRCAVRNVRLIHEARARAVAMNIRHAKRAHRQAQATARRR